MIKSKVFPFILVGSVLLSGALGFVLANNWRDDVDARWNEDLVYQRTDLPVEVNKQIATLFAFNEDIRRAEDKYGEPIQVNDMHIKMLVSPALDESIDMEIRRWAIAGLGSVYLDNAELTDHQRQMIENALYAVWLESEVEHARRVAFWTLVSTGHLENPLGEGEYPHAQSEEE